VIKNVFSCHVCFSKKLEVARYALGDNENILILESSPYPAYYSVSGFPESLKTVKDHHLYLVVKKPFSCFQDRVLRYSFRVKKKLDLTLHASPGQMTFQHETHPCIRIRTNETAQLKPFINAFQELGIRFMSDRKVVPYLSFIQYKKYMEFVETGNGIFKDKENVNRYFIRIPIDLEFDVFDKVIMDVKNNCDFHLFDASLVYMNCGDDFTDMVSIYSDHCDESRLPELKKSLEEIIESRHT